MLSELPGPDHGKKLKSVITAVGGDLPVCQFYKSYSIKSPPELVTMHLCLDTGKFAKKIGLSVAAKNRVRNVSPRKAEKAPRGPKWTPRAVQGAPEDP